MGSQRERFEVVVVGGGQAGLATAYYLSLARIPFVVLDAVARIGDAWRKRWDSLRLFTPARIDALPGMRFPLRPGELPSKDQMADYLEAYANHFKLPVRSGVRVASLEAEDDHFLLQADGRELEADQVIIATGANQTARIPTFASDLDPGIVQLSAADYTKVAQVKPGGILVVGAGNSGAEIALGAAKEHRTWLSGNPTGSGSAAVFSRPGWWMAMHVMTRATPMGRNLIRRMSRRGAPLLRIRSGDLAAAGVERVPRTTGVANGKPRLEDGRLLDVRTVVWCTGFGQDFSWIHLPVLDESGRPLHERGVVNAQPGLYFVGLPFLFGVTSALIGGVGSDACHVVKFAIAKSRGRVHRPIWALT